MVEGLSRFSIEKLSIDWLMTKKNKKLISKVYKKMLKQIEKDPMQNWFEININNYSLKEMRIIKRYFCDCRGFGFSKNIPDDKMIEKTYVCANGSVTYSTLGEANYKTMSSPIDKFYITWFDEEN